jgi:hypothetical protein
LTHPFLNATSVRLAVPNHGAVDLEKIGNNKKKQKKTFDSPAMASGFAVVDGLASSIELESKP